MSYYWLDLFTMSTLLFVDSFLVDFVETSLLLYTTGSHLHTDTVRATHCLACYFVTFISFTITVIKRKDNAVPRCSSTDVIEMAVVVSSCCSAVGRRVNQLFSHCCCCHSLQRETDDSRRNVYVLVHREYSV